MPQIQQLPLDFDLAVADLYPTVEGLRRGDLWEGYNGRAFPRPLRVLGTQVEQDGAVTVIYMRRVGTEKQFGAKSLPARTPVDIRPPF